MDIFDEVVKDIKDEQHYNAFKKALPIIVVSTILLILLMSVKSWWDSKTLKHNTEMGDLLNNAIVLALSNQTQAANESFDYIIKEAKNHTKDLAELGKVIPKLNSRSPDALKSLEAIADNKNFYELTQRYAQVLWLSIAIDLPLDKIEQPRFSNYIHNFQNEDTVFFGTVNLVKALWLMKQDKNQEAEDTLKRIIESKFTNQTNKHNAQAILANLKVKKYNK